MLFTGFFHHLRDGEHHISGASESKSMQGITLGCCRKSECMIFYCPHHKQLYATSDFKLDGHHTPNTYNPQYDVGIFAGLYSHGSPNRSVELYPEGTSLSFPLQSSHDQRKTIQMQGAVISDPIPNNNAQLPTSAMQLHLHTWL
jgi:hypothetical protein